MKDIAEALGVGIPKADAAAFFLRVKTAGWGDPPDETGELEGQFSVPIEQCMEKMRAVVVAKFRKMIAYQVYSNSLRSLEHHSISREFDTHAWQEKDMADQLMRRLAALGGPIQLDDIEPPPASSSPVEIIKRMIRAEQEGIAAQRELLDCVGPDNPMKHMVEEHMGKDQYHLDELWQMLPTEHHAPIIDTGGRQEGVQEDVVEPPPPEGEEAAPPEGAPPVEEAPPEEKVAKTLKDVESETIKKYRRMGGKAGTRAGAKKGGKRGLGYGILGGAAAGALKGKGLKGRALSAAAGAAAGGAAAGTAGAGAGAVKGRKKGKSIGESIGRMANLSRRQWLGQMMRKRQAELLKDKPKGGKEKKGSAELDITNAACMRFNLALYKMAQGGEGQGMAPPGPPQPAEPAGVDGAAPLPPQPPKPDPGPPVAPSTMPTNYLAAEQLAQQAQQGNEARFYQGKLQESQGAMQGMEQQVQEIQGQLQGLQQQAAESSAQIQQATQSAVAAQDEATRQTMEAAKLRMGAQKMRAQMLEIASQEPEQLANETMPGAAPGAETEQGPAEKTGPAGQAPNPGAGVDGSAAPGGVGEGEGVEPEVGSYEQQAAGAEPQTALKTGSVGQLAMKQLAKRAPYALGGAALGAGGAAIQGERAPGQEASARKDISELEGQAGESFGASLRLAKAKARLGESEHLQAHKGKNILMGGLKGAALGAIAGPAAGEQTARGVGALKGKLQQIFG